jgi:trans-aconitate methyltransferase
MTLVDRSPAMLRASRRLNPGCAHVRGDMRSARLGRTFDAVFIHDALMHLATERDLRRAAATAFAHLRDGGVALFAPDFVRETFRPAVASGEFRKGGREIRWVGWDVDGVATLAYVMKEGGRVRGVIDRFQFALFSRATWMRVLRGAGFRPLCIRAVDGRDAFIGRR